MEFTKSEAKQWAKEHYGGLCGTLCPSFTPDLMELDEEGIRHDVRHNIINGSIVMEDRSLRTLDTTEVMAKAKEKSVKVREWVGK